MKLTEFTPRVLDAVTTRAYPTTATFDEPEPYVVYSALKQKFGAPNATTHNHSQWCYEFALANAMIRLQDWKLYGWTLEIYPDDKQKATAETLMAEILALFTQYGIQNKAQVKNLAKSSSRSMLQNPYRIYFDSASSLIDMAEHTANPQQRDTLCRSAFFMFLSSFEGLLNLVYDVYLKPGIRASPEGQDAVIKANLDQKILLAPLYCMCFADETITFPDDLYKRYKAIRSLRNNFIHANMTDAMRTSIIKEDGKVFLIEPHRSKEYNLPLVVSGLDITHLRFTQGVIREMQAAIINAMDPHNRSDFAQALEREEIIIERDRNGMNYIRKQF